MFIDRETLHTTLFGLVGFNNSTDSAYPTLAPSLLTSRSAKVFNDVHSLLTTEVIDQTSKNFDHYNYPAYDNGAEYSVGEKVISSGVSYEYINAAATTGNAPPNTSYWVVINSLSDYLTKAVYRGIDNMIDEYAEEKKVRSRVKSIFNDALLFNGSGYSKDTITNEDKFVGLRIRMRKGERHLVTIINKIGHQFDQVITNTDLTLHLYHSSQQQPVATYNIGHTTAKNSQWTTITADKILRYLSDLHDAGGDFFLGYKQSDLTALPNSPQAITKDVFWSDAPCDCDDKWSDYWKQYSPFVDIVGFSIDESEMVGGALWDDPQKLILTNTLTYGLNLNISSKCDLAPFIIQEEDQLVNALFYHVGLVLLEGVAYNIRTGNTVANTVRTDAKRELFKHNGAWGTVHDKARKAIKGLAFDFSDMDDSCMPQDDDMVLQIGTGSH